MKLHEAIEECLASGSIFIMRRESWRHLESVKIRDEALYWSGYLSKAQFSIDDLLADDWIVE